MLQMRFAPPRDAEGRSAESLFRRHIDWALNDAVPLAPARLTAHLTLDDDRIDGCTVDQEGPVPEAWARIACRIFTASRAFYLPAAHLPHVATITVEIQPAGSPALTAPLPPGRLIATRRTEFDVDDEGDPTNCRTTRNEGFGSGRLDRQTPCGFFASGAWFDTDKAPRGSLHGAVEVRVYLGEAGAH
jgi:hypothetical protein